jgi:hypothetical protein
MPKYPQPGELYSSHLYPGQVCKVVSVVDAQVTFEWVGQYRHVEPQIATVIRFIRDFAPAED